MVLDLETQANVTAALKLAGMYQHSVTILISDNGGPLDHATNAPLRGERSTAAG